MALLILSNTSLMSVPKVVSVVTMTTAISPAMRPYSMAVAPSSSRQKRSRAFFIATPFPQTGMAAVEKVY